MRADFTRDQVADLTSFENLVQDFFSLLPRGGATAVDLQDFFFRYTVDSVTGFLFGVQSAYRSTTTRSATDCSITIRPATARNTTL